jgi:aminopeptidase N
MDGYDWVETEFDETLDMSSYLVAMVVSDFKCKGVQDVAMPMGSKIGVNICARPNAYDQLDYPLNVSIEIIQFFEKYYQTPYPFPKCGNNFSAFSIKIFYFIKQILRLILIILFIDHVGVKDFRFGAMENWGLAIYLERYLIHSKNTTKSEEQQIVRIIAHEISHMWFGNLVTPKWWSDLWLNEGFARYMENVGTNAIRPHWKMVTLT